MKNKEYYDKIYNKSVEYGKHYSEIIYFPIYKNILKRLHVEDAILELGCGAGQLAHYLRDNNFINYTGIDFSPKAIELARGRTNQIFLTDDIFKATFNFFYDTVIAVEVFEHLYYEKILQKINKGTQIFFSVPNFKTDSHLFSWSSKEEVKEDFEHDIDIVSIETPLKIKDKVWYLVNGFVK
ncbi:MAG TPA: class I SAM-dependent methyltransferase [Methanosarcinales archaeon]|nr:class I SAM-dependent methyltransferase [Methanosarcinales archaeon]